MIKDAIGNEVQRQNNAAAFTITEVVISAILLLLSLSMLLATFVSSRSSIAITHNSLTAMKIAASDAEQLMTNTYASIAPTNLTLTNTLIACQMSRSVTTNALDTYKDITISVEWITPDSSRRQALTNYITICNTN